MRTRIGIGVLALATALAAGGTAQAQTQQQYYEVPPSSTIFPGPLGHPRYETGGFFTAVEFKFMRQSTPLGDQVIAVRGYVDFDGSIEGVPGKFIGSGTPALNANQVDGPGTFVPGSNLTIGWRFLDGVTVSVSWWHLVDARYAATATLVPPGLQPGPLLDDTFLFSPVFNFPAEFAGQPNNTGLGNLGATFGIWNAASVMQLRFIQRFDLVDFTGRFPISQTTGYRNYFLVGPRAVIMWERFKWRTVDADVNGAADSADVGIYSNVVSNRLYGVHAGAGQEWYLGDTPVGAFSISLDTEAALYVDFVKGRAKYEREDRVIAGSRARNFWTLAPGLEGKLNFWWYPAQAIQVRLGYDVLAIFNTMASPEPVDFNFGGIDPGWDKGITRYLHGLGFGVGLVF